MEFRFDKVTMNQNGLLDLDRTGRFAFRSNSQSSDKGDQSPNRFIAIEIGWSEVRKMNKSQVNEIKV